MYKAHFSLRESPFGITPDTSFFFACDAHQEALNTLLVAVRNGEGFVKITGEVGTGKTLLCRKFLASLGDGFISAYIPNPYLEPRALLLALADELGVALDQDVDQHRLLKALNLALLSAARNGKRVVLCLDEAQAMPLETLESLRLLTSLETEKRKLLQVVLFGQPELDRKLDQESIRQLKQRITFQYCLAALNVKELDNYLDYRLAIAGYNGVRPFSKGAVKQLHRASGGVPRLINIVAHKAMMLAYGEGAREIGTRHIRAATADTPAARRAGWRLWPILALLVCTGAGSAWALFQ